MEKNFSEYQPSLMVICIMSYYHVLSMGRRLMSENIYLPTSRVYAYFYSIIIDFNFIQLNFLIK